MAHPALVDERPEDMLTVKQAAKILNTSRSQIYALFTAADLEYIVVGKRGKRIERAELQRYIDSHRRRGPIDRSMNRWESKSDIEKAATAGLSRKRATVGDLKRRLEQKRKPESTQQNRKAS
ncbi:MAG: hypothetical protein CL583_00625 [Alteromonadaceae bacterium]|nr:hypothetical protein [Alteromonadaceae bacterium]|tara:strand:+ start:656 stop:1021 length:366 start_codon:yes stop_codon:yes gene_type:complete